MSLKDRRYKALNTAYLEHNSERAGFPRDFKLKGPDGFNLRLTYHDFTTVCLVSATGIS